MLTQEEDVEAHALKRRGWSISAIARHLGRDRKTIRAYLAGQRRPGERRPAVPDSFAPFEPYVRERLAEDPHLWATALYDELVALGYERSYQVLTRELRRRALRPRCEPCAGTRGRATIEIAHPPGEEIQWDWLELPDAPWAAEAHLLVGTLSHSGRCRAVFAESEDQAHLVEAIDKVLRRIGGTARRWRTDRMASVCDPDSGRLHPSFAAVARYYGVGVDVCPARRANRKGAVEARNHFIAQRFWRTARVADMADAQAKLDRFLASTGDDRRRGPGARVGQAARAERLRALPAAPYPATLQVTRRVGPSALVAYQGNRYSLPPGLEGGAVEVRHRLGEAELEILAPSGAVVARHRLASPGTGALVRADAHRAALEEVVLAAFTTKRPCKRKANRPPGPAALAAAAALRADVRDGAEVVVDLGAWARAAEGAR
jgi:transposase